MGAGPPSVETTLRDVRCGIRLAALAVAVVVVVAGCGSGSATPEEPPAVEPALQEEPTTVPEEAAAAEPVEGLETIEGDDLDQAGQETATPPEPESRLSHREYVAAADAICAEANAELDGLAEPESLDELAELFRQAIEIQENEIDQLRALQPPDEDNDKANRAYDLLEQIVGIVKGAQESVVAGDVAALNALDQQIDPLQSEADQIARELDLQVCGDAEQLSEAGDGGTELASPMPVAELTAAGCTPFEGVPPAGWDHFTEIPDDYEFGTFPRTAGVHDPQLLIWNLYVRPVDQMMIGHNLEHGGIYVQYGDGVPAETVELIAEWWAQDPNGIIVAPLPELDPEIIALGAWYAPIESSDVERVYTSSTGELAYCNEFDEEAFTAFKDAFRGNGPEPFPVELLRPGT